MTAPTPTCEFCFRPAQHRMYASTGKVYLGFMALFRKRIGVWVCSGHYDNGVGRIENYLVEQDPQPVAEDPVIPIAKHRMEDPDGQLDA